MSFIFPINPAPGDIAVGANGATWVWDGAKWVGGMGGPYLPLAGGTMTGRLLLYANPTEPFEATTKDYVDRVANAWPDPPMDGQVYGLMLRNWTPALPMTGGFMRGTINMNSWPLTGLRWPLVDTDAVPKEYVDNVITNLLAYQGTWQVAANVPNLSITVGNGPGFYWVAVTADPTVPETAPVGTPGIAGLLISNGSFVIWNNQTGVYQVVQSGQLTKAEADALYVALAGSTMTGDLILVGDPVQDLQAATKQYVDNEIADAIAALPPGGGPGGGGIPEAPTDGQTYGRDGAVPDWIPVLTLTAVINGGQW